MQYAIDVTVCCCMHLCIYYDAWYVPDVGTLHTETGQIVLLFAYAYHTFIPRYRFWATHTSDAHTPRNTHTRREYTAVIAL